MATRMRLHSGLFAPYAGAPKVTGIDTRRFTLSQQSNGNGQAPAEDNTMIFVGVGLVAAAAAAWWFLR